MNANELASDIENGMFNDANYNKKKTAEFIRQQQAEYYSLLVNHDKLYAKVLEQQAEIDTYKLQNSRQIDTHRYEPVAWMMENPQNTSAYLTFEKPTREMKISHQVIPLYTHPAKTLTDEEINDFTVRIYNCRTGAEAHEIVLAILRKAQEK